MAKCMMKGCDKDGTALEGSAVTLCDDHRQAAQVRRGKGEDGAPYSFNIKVSEKGCVMVQAGYRRFPIVLYKLEWESLFKHQEEIKAFIRNNSAKLSTKVF